MAWHVIGIDPAPTKPAVVCVGDRFQEVEPHALLEFITHRAEANLATLIAWDAPLSFDPVDLYDRRIDKVVRRWAKKHVESGRFSVGAINSRPFAALPHWAVSCSVLGLPFGVPPLGLRLAAAAVDFSRPALLAIEVHPAVAIGAWWLASSCSGPLPRYKSRATECGQIAEALQLSADCGATDDKLDAFVAYRLGEMFLQKEAIWVGDPRSGGYVMPQCQAAEELCRQLSETGTPPNFGVQRTPRRRR